MISAVTQSIKKYCCSLVHEMILYNMLYWRVKYLAIPFWSTYWRVNILALIHFPKRNIFFTLVTAEHFLLLALISSE